MMVDKLWTKGADDMFDLNDKIAFITGGSSGIGEASAYGLAMAGATVIIGDIRIEAAEKVACALKTRGYMVEAVQVDVSSSTSVNDVIEDIAARYGRLDILFSNAGILLDQTIEQITDRDWDRTMSVNVNGAFFCCRAALKYMKEQGYGKIIITSSVGGKMSHPTAGVHYISSKGALLSFTRHLANQVGQYGITVNAIAPGTTETPLISHRSEGLKKEIAAKIPLLRLGSPEELAGAVLFFASDCSNYITGEIMDVNGGLYID